MLRGVIIDLDQTLIDSRKAHELALNDALERHGLPKVHVWVYGITSENLIRLNFPRIQDELVSKIALMKKIKLRNYFKLIRKVNGADKLLKFLKEHKMKTCLVTSNARTEIKALLSYFRWQKAFDEIVGKDDVQHPKPSPEPTLAGLKKLNMHRTEVIYLGDADADIGSAKGAGVKIIISQAVHNTADADKADYIVASLKEAKEKIGELMKL